MLTEVPDRMQVELFRSTIAERFGLQYDDDKLDQLADLLRARLAATGSTDFGDYIDRLALPDRSSEIRALVEQLTVNETYFFRNADNFRALTEHVLPEHLKQEADSHRLRILSAGCASGEEPYSLAIALRETLPDLERWDVKILAVDLNASMLERAALGQYSGWSLRATPQAIRRRYFRARDRDFVLDPQIRAMVTFDERNLAAQDPSLWRAASYDIVFCRNVLMYFTPEIMRDLVGRIAGALRPGGFLFLGYAETLRGLSQDFRLCHTHSTFYYQRRAAADVQSDVGTLPARLADSVVGQLAVEIDHGATWVEAIHGASERIARLANTSSNREDVVREAAVATPEVRSWDLGLVLEAMRQERFSDALALLSVLPPDSHTDADALLLRAVLLTNSGMIDRAEGVCARLLALDELNAGAHYVMALCREHAADQVGAIEHDQTAVYLDPSFAMPHLHIGLLAKRGHDPVRARHELSQALVLLAREDASRLLLFGGGFSRDALLALCRSEFESVGGA